jgi:hypothetical protein
MSDAATQDAIHPSSITMCPRSLGARDNTFTDANLANVQYIARGAVAANPVKRAALATTQKSRLQQLSAVKPTALTLLHELFHLVLGNDVTYSAVGEVYGIFDKPYQIVGLDYDYAIENPESFAQAAVSYDYTVNGAADGDGNKIEFYSGYATQG